MFIATSKTSYPYNLILVYYKHIQNTINGLSLHFVLCGGPLVVEASGPCPKFSTDYNDL